MDNGRRAMAPDPDSVGMRDVMDEHGRPVTTTCDDCGAGIRFSDWPFCGGNANRHWRDFSTATEAVWDEAVASNKARPNTTLVKDK